VHSATVPLIRFDLAWLLMMSVLGVPLLTRTETAQSAHQSESLLTSFSFVLDKGGSYLRYFPTPAGTIHCNFHKIDVLANRAVLNLSATNAPKKAVHITGKVVRANSTPVILRQCSLLAETAAACFGEHVLNVSEHACLRILPTMGTSICLRASAIHLIVKPSRAPLATAKVRHG
jgi:hypothetical protein